MMHLRNKPALLLGILLLFSASASAQTVTFVGGAGSLLTTLTPPAQLRVLVRNAQGQPVSGATVTWSLAGQGLLGPAETLTDSTGVAANTFSHGGFITQANYAQSTITATALGASASTFATTSGSDPLNPQIVFVQVALLNQDEVLNLQGPAGSTGVTPIRVQVFAVGQTGFASVPNVLVKLIPETPGGPSIACSGNTGLTDFLGNANCLPTFSGQQGTGRYFIDVGDGYRNYGPFSFQVTQGQFAAFRITGGNNQVGNPNTQLPVALTARTEDPTGNAISGVPVFWDVVVPGTATIINASTQSDASGVVSAQVRLGTTAGQVQIRLRNEAGTIAVVYTVQTNLIITGITAVSGNNQEAVINSPFPQPLIVQVNSAAGPVQLIQVQFTSTGGVTLPNNGVAVTDANGRASITAQAGPNAGPVQVIASASNLTASFNLSIRRPGPQVSLTSFVNGAGGQAGGISPTAVAAIYGAGIASGLQGCVSGQQIVGPLPIIVSNVTVRFNSPGFAAYAPIFAVCNLGQGQEFVTLQVPAELPLGSTTVTVGVGNDETQVSNVPVTPVSVGIFETIMSDRQKRAVLVHASDGSYVSLENRARPGEELLAYVTGLGRPRTVAGLLLGTNQGGIPNDPARPQVPVIVGVNDGGAETISSEYAEGLTGVYVVRFRVPNNVPSGANINFAIAAIINDQFVFGNPSRIPIQ